MVRERCGCESAANRFRAFEDDATTECDDRSQGDVTTPRTTTTLPRRDRRPAKQTVHNTSKSWSGPAESRQRRLADASFDAWLPGWRADRSTANCEKEPNPTAEDFPPAASTVRERKLRIRLVRWTSRAPQSIRRAGKQLCSSYNTAGCGPECACEENTEDDEVTSTATSTHSPSSASTTTATTPDSTCDKPPRESTGVPQPVKGLIQRKKRLRQIQSCQWQVAPEIPSKDEIIIQSDGEVEELPMSKGDRDIDFNHDAPPTLGHSDDEEDIPDTPIAHLSKWQAHRREGRLQRERPKARHQAFIDEMREKNDEIKRAIDEEVDASLASRTRDFGPKSPDPNPANSGQRGFGSVEVLPHTDEPGEGETRETVPRMFESQPGAFRASDLFGPLATIAIMATAFRMLRASTCLKRSQAPFQWSLKHSGRKSP